MSRRFALAVLMMLATLSTLIYLSRAQWSLDRAQHSSFGRIVPASFFDDYAQRPR